MYYEYGRCSQKKIADIIANDYDTGILDIDAYLNNKEIFNHVIRIMGNGNKKVPDSVKLNNGNYKITQKETDEEKEYVCNLNGGLEIFIIKIKL